MGHWLAKLGDNFRGVTHSAQPLGGNAREQSSAAKLGSKAGRKSRGETQNNPHESPKRLRRLGRRRVEHLVREFFVVGVQHLERHVVAQLLAVGFLEQRADLRELRLHFLVGLGPPER